MEDFKVIKDDFGGMKIVSKEGDTLIYNRIHGAIIVKLRLHSENRKSLLGTIIPNNKTIYVERIRTKHLFRKNDSYGFNYYFLKTVNPEYNVQLKDESDIWIIPVQNLLDNGTYLNFKAVGFELQIFVSLNFLNNYLQPKIF